MQLQAFEGGQCSCIGDPHAAHCSQDAASAKDGHSKGRSAPPLFTKTLGTDPISAGQLRLRQAAGGQPGPSASQHRYRGLRPARGP